MVDKLTDGQTDEQQRLMSPSFRAGT